jgi:hypothetical protein
MGDYPDSPFARCDNHLNLAAQAGLGTNRLDKIHVLGAQISEVRTPFVSALWISMRSEANP